MIDVILYYGSDVVLIRIMGSEVFFKTATFGMQWGDISGVKFVKSGVDKDYPDLKDNPDWETIAKQRFKDKLKTFQTEMEVYDFIIDDLKQYGYVPKFRQRQGFRREVIKEQPEVLRPTMKEVYANLDKETKDKIREDDNKRLMKL